MADKKNRQQIRKEIKFWKSQPVLQMFDNYKGESTIHTEIDIENTRKEPYNLPNGFEWGLIDLDKEVELNALYDFLDRYYVEGGKFRLSYSKEILKWALCVPGHDKNMFVCVKISGNDRIVGFISGIHVIMKVYDKTVKMTEINFLCVHKKLRDKRLAPVLIKEITRRSYLKGITSAIYTAGKPITRILSTTQYYHRLLNPKKLVEIGFSDLPKGKNMSNMVKMYKVTGDATLNLIRMCENDVEGVHKLMTTYLKKYDMHHIFSVEEIRHLMLPRKGVIETFVVKNNDGVITDLCSYYILPAKITQDNDKHKILNSVCSHYNISTSVNVCELVKNLLIKIKDKGFDVFNMLNIMDNNEIVEKMRFLKGNGFLYYYLYNWKCKFVNCRRNGTVLC
jgi:glycylpeptide N-tetradecanoyltransferase